MDGREHATFTDHREVAVLYNIALELNARSWVGLLRSAVICWLLIWSHGWLLGIGLAAVANALTDLTGRHVGTRLAAERIARQLDGDE